MSLYSCVDVSVRRKRVRFGGNKKQNFTEGWVEFLEKRVAKAVAMRLNNNPVGGKKRSYYHDDLWNIKYLAKFKWTHLTEKIGMWYTLGSSRNYVAESFL